MALLISHKYILCLPGFQNKRVRCKNAMKRFHSNALNSSASFVSANGYSRAYGCSPHLSVRIAFTPLNIPTVYHTWALLNIPTVTYNITLVINNSSSCAEIYIGKSGQTLNACFKQQLAQIKTKQTKNRMHQPVGYYFNQAGRADLDWPGVPRNPVDWLTLLFLPRLAPNSLANLQCAV